MASKPGFRLGLVGLVWACCGLFAPVWACLGLFGPVWACLGLFGPVAEFQIVADSEIFRERISDFLIRDASSTTADYVCDLILSLITIVIAFKRQQKSFYLLFATH